MPRLKKQYKNTSLSRLVSHVGTMLRFYREEAGLSQNKLAKASGISISTINEIENCVVNDMRLSTLSVLASHLGIDPLKLMLSSNLPVSDDDKKDFQTAFKILNKISRKLS
jgi:transcriptional regulator with XRE-family HTH domain